MLDWLNGHRNGLSQDRINHYICWGIGDCKSRILHVLATGWLYARASLGFRTLFKQSPANYYAPPYFCYPSPTLQVKSKRVHRSIKQIFIILKIYWENQKQNCMIKKKRKKNEEKEKEIGRLCHPAGDMRNKWQNEWNIMANILLRHWTPYIEVINFV